MDLRRLPTELALDTWMMLDIFAQARLYATLDKSIHRSLLRLPHVRADLHDTEHRGYARLFLQQLRNITELEDTSMKISQFQLSLLVTLNPVHLSIHSLMISLPPSRSIPSDPEQQLKLQSYTDFIDNHSDKLGLFDTTRLLPRLQTLIVRAPLAALWELAHARSSGPQRLGDPAFEAPALARLLVLPSSLTSLSIGVSEVRAAIVLDVLPSTLRTLALSFKFDCRDIDLFSSLARMPSLSKLSLRGSAHANVQEREGDSLPHSLTDVSISGFNTLATDLLSRPGPLKHGLRSLSIKEIGDFRVHVLGGVLNLSVSLPSVTDLTLVPSYQESYITETFPIQSLPGSLTKLNLALPQGTADLRLPLSSLNCLTHLGLSCVGESKLHLYSSHSADSVEQALAPHPHIDVLHLPPSLTNLELASYNLRSASKDAIKDLPQNLLRLSTSKISLSLAADLHAARPKLYISCSKPIGLWESTNGLQLQKEFSHLWSPVLDVDAFSDAAVQQYGLQRVLLSLDLHVKDRPFGATTQSFPQTTSLIARRVNLPKPEHSQRSFPCPLFFAKAFPNLQQLVLWRPWGPRGLLLADALPPSLTDLEVRNIEITGQAKSLYNLRRISSDSPKSTAPLVVDDMAVVHLDAPSWTVCIRDEETHLVRNFSCFRADVVEYVPSPRKTAVASTAPSDAPQDSHCTVS